MLALDPAATRDAWAWDMEMERGRRLHWLFRDLRAVDRRFYLSAYLPTSPPSAAALAPLSLRSSR
jgi:hypothetical protein